ncbi:MAG: hypothetical protein H6559_16290 [Lewinellaceae bacterium]|nr:hypothetical protein [Lewinellaceae bacterium]
MRIITTLSLLWICSFTVYGQEPAFRIRRAAVFKNGTAFLEKEAVVDASSGSADVSGYPVQSGQAGGMPPVVTATYPFRPEAYEGAPVPVLFGTTFWSAPGNEVLEVVAGSREEVEKAPADNLARLLQLNIGKKVCIWTKDTKGPINCGNIVGHSTPGDGQSAGQLLLRDGQTLHQFAVHNIQRLEFGEDAVYEEEVASKKPSLRLKLARAEKQQLIRFSCMQKGMSWFPNYHMVLLGNGKARLSLFANLMNDIEKLDQAPVSFAVGIPSFRFGHLAEPLFSGQAVPGFLKNLNNLPGENLAMFSNAITSQRVEANADAFSGAGAFPDSEGLMQEDLFFYELDEVSLEPGERGLFKLLEQEVAYEDLYVVDIKRAPMPWQRTRAEEEGPKNLVWHALKFKNRETVPLTTGTVSFFSREGEGLKPIGQNELSFTPARSNALVKMVAVPDILVSDESTEAGRKSNARDHKDLITVKARIRAVNYKGKKITLRINREITGRFLNSDTDWETSASFDHADTLNALSNATWVVTLEPKEKRELSYTYEVYE